MLGTGRPFYIEIVDPKVVPSSQELAKAMSTIECNINSKAAENGVTFHLLKRVSRYVVASHNFVFG